MKLVKPSVIIKPNFKERLYQRRFIFPNAVTVGALFCGFLACIYSANGQFQKAAIAIAIAIVLDGLDGRVARRLNASSKFGLEFDSLSDVISFGVAPAVLTYFWCFKATADQFGVFLCFLYTLAAAGRLARFNINANETKSFNGLPTPGAAGLVAAAVNLWPEVLPANLALTVFVATALLSLAYLMISNVTFLSIKLIRVSDFTLKTQLMIGALIGLIWYHPQLGLFILAAAYVLSGWKSLFSSFKNISLKKKEGQIE